MPAPTEPAEKRKISDDDWEFTSVVLEKSSTRQGFGIAISGGKDNPHFKTGDTSILVTDIIKGSPADGTLRIGDKLISVNEKLVDGGTHKDAVHALKAAGMQARMEIKRPVPKKPAPKVIEAPESNLIPYPPDNSTPKGSIKSEERGRERKKPKEMEQESGERVRRSRSRNREDENGEKPRRSKSRERSDGEEKMERKSHVGIEVKVVIEEKVAKKNPASIEVMARMVKSVTGEAKVKTDMQLKLLQLSLFLWLNHLLQLLRNLLLLLRSLPQLWKSHHLQLWKSHLQLWKMYLLLNLLLLLKQQLQLK